MLVGLLVAAAVNFLFACGGFKISPGLNREGMSDGTITELHCRGKQDAFFIQNAQRTWFGTDYDRRPGGARDIVRLDPYTPVTWDSRVEIDLPRYGDILKEAQIRINMPTWLPPEVAAMNLEPSKEITLPTNLLPSRTTTYGWVNGIANALIAKWELYADNLKLAEGYGQVNQWYPLTRTTHNKAPLLVETTGQHVVEVGPQVITTGNARRAIQNNATPPELSFTVPLPGCQGRDDVGLPLWAMRSHQRLFLRLTISPVTTLAESSDFVQVLGGPTLYDISPTPWSGKQIYINGLPTSHRTVPLQRMGAPVIYGWYDVLFLDNDTREALVKVPHSIPFSYQMLEALTFDQNTLIPGYRFSKRLDIRGFFEILTVRFVSELAILQNRYYDTFPYPPRNGSTLNLRPTNTTDWVTDIGLIVNGEERINVAPPDVMDLLTVNTKMPRDMLDKFYFFVFGEQVDREPAGNLFISRTHKVVLQFTFADVPIQPILNNRACIVTILGRGWNILDIQDGFAKVRYPD